MRPAAVLLMFGSPNVNAGGSAMRTLRMWNKEQASTGRMREIKGCEERPAGGRIAGRQELDGSAIGPFEGLLFKALESEAETPPATMCPRRSTIRARELSGGMTDSGVRTIEWRAKRSFIADLSRPGRRVARFCTDRGDVLCQPQPRSA